MPFLKEASCSTMNDVYVTAVVTALFIYFLSVGGSVIASKVPGSILISGCDSL